MKLFESCYLSKFSYFLRYFDTEENESFVQKLNNTKSEYFVEDIEGDFTDIYTNKKYTKTFGTATEANENCIYNFKPNEIEIRDNWQNLYNKDPNVWYLDIETRVGVNSNGFPVPDKALEEVCLIQIFDKSKDEIYILGCQEFYKSDYYLDGLKYKVNYIKCKNEQNLFDNFFKLLSILKPLIVYAWNGCGFDFPYLYNRAKKLGFETYNFSPFGKFGDPGISLRERNFNMQGRAQYLADIQSGSIFYIDMKELYRRFVLKPRASYSLQNISEIELGASKVDHSEFKTFDDFFLGNYKYKDVTKEHAKEFKKELLIDAYKNNSEDLNKLGHSLFIYYGILDVVLLESLDKKLKLTKLALRQSEMHQCLPNAIVGTIKPWTSYIKNILYNENKIAINLYASDHIHVTGGFVRDPELGKKEWIVSADVNSMYPMLSMKGSNISPETYININPNELNYNNKFEEISKFIQKFNNFTQDEKWLLNLNNEDKIKLKELLKKYNVCLAPNNCLYNKEFDGIVPTLVSQIYANRKKTKKEKFKYDQAIIEIDEILETK